VASPSLCLCHGSRGVFMDQCVKLMLRTFKFGILLSECFVYRQTVTRLKRFTRYEHYESEMEDIITGSYVPKIRAFSCGLMMLC